MKLIKKLRLSCLPYFSSSFLTIMSLFLFLAVVLGFRNPLGRLPAIYEITKPGQAYFEIEADKDNLSLNEEVEIKVYLTVSSSQKFDNAVVVIEWDEDKLEFVSSQGYLLNERGGAAQFLSTFAAGYQGRRILVHFTPPDEAAMLNETEEPILFASLILRAKEEQPQVEVALSSDDVNDLGLHFQEADLDANAVDQSLADPEKLKVILGGVPGVGGPAIGGNLALQVKFEGVPANNNEMNLPEESRTQKVWIELEEATEGIQAFAGLVDFRYIGKGLWEGEINF